MERIGITPYIVVTFIWSYLLSVVFAKQFWGELWNRVLLALDLSPNQGWNLPIIVSAAVAAIGMPQAIRYIIFLRRRAHLGMAQQITFTLGVVGTAWCLWGMMAGLLTKRGHLVPEVAAPARKKFESILSAGVLENGSYSNASVGVSLKLPKGWQPMSLNAIARAKFSGAQAVFGKNNETSRVMAGTLPGTYLLLVIQKYPESHTGYNPSLSLSAYEKQAVAATGIKNLEEYANSFKNMSGPHHVRIGPVLKTFGEANGHYLRIEAQFPNATIQQHNYVTETRTFYVVMVASVMDEADGAVLKESASTLMIYDK